MIFKDKTTGEVLVTMEVPSKEEEDIKTQCPACGARHFTKNECSYCNELVGFSVKLDTYDITGKAKRKDLHMVGKKLARV